MEFLVKLFTFACLDLFVTVADGVTCTSGSSRTRESRPVEVSTLLTDEAYIGVWRTEPSSQCNVYLDIFNDSGGLRYEMRSDTYRDRGWVVSSYKSISLSDEIVLLFNVAGPYLVFDNPTEPVPAPYRFTDCPEGELRFYRIK